MLYQKNFLNPLSAYIFVLTLVHLLVVKEIKYVKYVLCVCVNTEVLDSFVHTGTVL